MGYACNGCANEVESLGDLGMCPKCVESVLISVVDAIESNPTGSVSHVVYELRKNRLYTLAVLATALRNCADLARGGR